MTKRLITLVTIIAVGITSLAHPTQTKAADKSKITYSSSALLYWTGVKKEVANDLYHAPGYLYGKNVPQNAMIINLQSSDSSVVQAEAVRDEEEDVKDKTIVHLIKKQEGKATVSFDLIWGSQKTNWEQTGQIAGTDNIKHFTVNVTVLKYENPVKSFKLGKKNLASSFNVNKVRTNYVVNFGAIETNKAQKITLKKKQKKLYVNVKLKKGYKFAGVNKTSFYKVKNGKKFKLAKYEKKGLYMFIFYKIDGVPDRTFTLATEVKFKRK